MGYIAISGITDCYPVEHNYWLLTPGCASQYNNCKLNFNILGTMQDPFRTTKELDKGYNEIIILSNKLISILSKRLNQVHNLEYSEQYWRIHIACWAYHYVGTFYERYTRLAAAKSAFNKITVIGDSDSQIDIPKDTRDFHIFATQDSSNLKFTTKIAEKLNIPIEYAKHYDSTLDHKVDKTPPKKNIFFNFLRDIKNIILIIIEKISAKKSTVICQQSYLPPWFQLALFLFTFGKIGFIKETKDVKINNIINSSDRSAMSLVPENADTLLALMISLVGDFIPIVFLEGYDRLSIHSQNTYSKYNPKAIYSSNLWWHHESFKHWAALSNENGIKIIGGSHGGGAFLNKFKIHEHFEMSVVDHYITWGWKSSPKDLALPAHKLISFYNSGTNSRNRYSQILYVLTNCPRHNSGFLEDFSLYIEWQQRFLKNISAVIEKNMLIRPHYVDWKWDLKQRLFNLNNMLSFDTWEYSLHSRIKKSRVCVYDYVGTTFVESLSMNVPTVIFQSDDIYPICQEDMIPYFELLRKASILHDTPESAMEWLDSVYDKIDEWWFSDDCQTAVSEFCNIYAKTDTVKNSLSAWAKLTSLND